MKRKIVMNPVFFLAASLVLLTAHSSLAQHVPNASHPVKDFLNRLEYSSRLKVEFDNNIFLTEDNETSDVREVFTQTLIYKLPKKQHYLQWGYSGNFAFYNEESLNLLAHKADFLYSYRPFKGFSIGIRDDYNWLADSKITSTIGDQILALGYIQNTPSLQMKYEMTPRTLLTVDAYQQFLDVKNGESDDYVDNKRLSVRSQLNYYLTPQQDWATFVGFEHKQITFPQVAEKAAVDNRPFIGVTKKFTGLFQISQEIGFDHIDMEDDANRDDRNMDSRFSLETIFSIYTKLRLSFDYGVKSPSLRRQYTQYEANTAMLNLSHAINPKTSLNFAYSYERQDFSNADILIGQTSEDKQTFIHNLALTLTKKIKKWLIADVKYEYTKRDADFASEGYTDNKISFALTAKY